MPDTSTSASADLPASDELLETLRWATDRLRELYGSRLKGLILFGSQARGEAAPESDVDVLIVLDGPIRAYDEAKRSSRMATHAAAYLGTAFSFVPMSIETFTEGRSPLVRSVREDGIDLLDLFPESTSPTGSSSDRSAEKEAFGSELTPASNRPNR